MTFSYLGLFISLNLVKPCYYEIFKELKFVGVGCAIFIRHKLKCLVSEKRMGYLIISVKVDSINVTILLGAPEDIPGIGTATTLNIPALR